MLRVDLILVDYCRSLLSAARIVGLTGVRELSVFSGIGVSSFNMLPSALVEY